MKNMKTYTHYYKYPNKYYSIPVLDEILDSDKTIKINKEIIGALIDSI